MSTVTMTLVCAAPTGTVPDAIQVIPAGAHATPKGDFVCDAESMRLILNDFAGRDTDMVIDYEHQTLKDVQAPAAGWVAAKVGLEDRGPDGIWARVQWNEQARNYLAKREYRYVSPVFVVRTGDRRVIQLVNVALTNQPNIDGMTPIVNKTETGDQVPGTGTLANLADKETMMMKKLCNKLGLAETATEEEILAAVDKLCGQSGMACKLTEALGLSATATEVEATAVIMAMKKGGDDGAALVGKVTALEQQLAKRDADEVIALAMKDGKLTPAQKDWAETYAAKDLEGFKLFVAKAPVAVPVGDVAGAAADQAPITNAVTLANKAAAYRAEQAKLGIELSATEAVHHVSKGK